MDAHGPNRFTAALTKLAQLDKANLDVALLEIVTTDAAVLGTERVSYWELSTDHTAISCRILYERTGGTASRGAQLFAAQFPAYFRALLQSQSIVANDAWTDPRTAEFVELYFRPHDIRSMLDIPVWRRGKLAGVLCHEHVREPRTWTPDEEAFAVGIGNLITVALEAGDRRRAEESYELVARASNDVLWDWDLRNNVLEWNDAMNRVFRYRPEQVHQSIEWWMGRIHPDDRQRVNDKLERMLRSDGLGYTDQYRWLRGDGTVATVIDRGHVVRGPDGEPIRMVGSLLDISERVEMHARLALSDRMASIGTLAAGVAHEINNPLTYAMANVTMALEETRRDELDVAGLKELLREALEGAERVRSIVRDLQVLSRPAEDDVRDLEVRPVVESSINMAWNEIRHRAQLVKEYRATPRVSMNRGRLGQVMLNLLINAAHAIKEGNASENEIRVRTDTSDGHAVIEVSDTGSGIPLDVQRRIFDPFFTTKAVGLGTGLGLSICHAIVTNAGGRIEVCSDGKHGTTMRVLLPVAAATTTVAATRVTAPTPRCRILVVDDEPLVRRAVTRMLESSHTVVTTDSGDAALTEVRSGALYDVILCDLMMPHMTGIELYKRLEADGSPLARRIVFMTGGAFSQDSADFVASSEHLVIEKPLDRAALSRAILAKAAAAAY